jgi:hypothetical protein
MFEIDLREGASTVLTPKLTTYLGEHCAEIPSLSGSRVTQCHRFAYGAPRR